MQNNYADLESFSLALANFLSESFRDKSPEKQKNIEVSFKDSDFLINITHIKKIKFYMPMFNIIYSDFFIKTKRSLYSKYINYRLDVEKLKNHKINFNNFFEVRTNDFEEALNILTQNQCYQKNKDCPLVWVIYPDGDIEFRKIIDNGNYFSFMRPYNLDTINIVKVDNPYKKPRNDKVIGRVLRMRNIYNTDGYVYR